MKTTWYVLAVVIILGTCAFRRAGVGSVNAGQASKPNIVLILTDDLDARSVTSMPRLRSLLFERGTSFAKFFVTTPVCCPSRASILTGQYAHNHGVLTDRFPQGGFKRFHQTGKEKSTIATWLKGAGYRTMLAGKYFDEYSTGRPTMSVPPGWDEWYAALEEFAYDGFNYWVNENGRIVAYGSRPEDYLTDVLARKATDFIRRAASRTEPFFIYLAPYVPHLPATPAPRHREGLAGVTAPRPPSFNEADLSEKPNWVRRKPRLSPAEIQAIDALYRKRLQSLLAVDEMVEEIVRTLEARNLLDRTFLFFTSDNGFHMGEHRLPPGKGTAYEEDIRVPLIVRGPGVPAGRTIDHLVLNIDLAPTFAQLGGASMPEAVDGQSLVPLLGNAIPSVEPWRKDFLVEHWAGSGQKTPEHSALRTRRYVYIEYATAERELYDLDHDPYEIKNIQSRAPAPLVKQLANRLNALKQCRAATCRK